MEMHSDDTDNLSWVHKWIHTLEDIEEQITDERNV